MKPLFLSVLFIVGAILLQGCHESVAPQLGHADTLLMEGEADSAARQLDNNNGKSWNDGGEFGNDYNNYIYKVLKVQAQIDRGIYLQGQERTLQDCASYFVRRDDAFAARAYLYLGLAQFHMKKQKDAMTSTKHAEEIAAATDNQWLREQVMNSMSQMNAMTGNFPLAIDYARRMLNGASPNDKRQLATVYNTLACIYDLKGQTDSAFHYIRALEGVVGYSRGINRAYFLANVGIFYMRQRKDSTAMSYLESSLRQKPLNTAYSALAVIYGRRGEMDKVRNMWQKALKTDDEYYRAIYLHTMFAQYCDFGQWKEAAQLANEYIDAKDSMMQKQQTMEINELQLQYDREVLRQQMMRYIVLAVGGCIVLVLLLTVYYFYSRNKRNKLSEEVSNRQSLIDTYLRRLHDMESDKNATQKEVDAMRHKVGELQRRQSEILVHGRKLYESISSGGKAVMWKKDDFASFIEYYKVIDLNYVQQLETEYDSLSPSNKFMMILKHMEMSDHDIETVLGISNGALRTARYRIKKKMNLHNGE